MRRTLWKDMKDIHKNQQGPWYAVGDFNNMVTGQDRIGGKLVTEAEIEDLNNMMNNNGMCERDNLGDFFTWHNKQSGNLIYSRIDRVLANVEWFHENSDVVLHILPPNVLDHGMLYITDPGYVKKIKKTFRFNNCWVDVTGFQEAVKENWSQPISGTPMYILWQKLLRLKTEFRKINRPVSDIQQKVVQSRHNLNKAYMELMNNRTSSQHIDEVKKMPEVIKHNEVEENMMIQRTKIG